MAINIIDGFYLGNSIPLDPRVVAADAATRTSITYKYDGLRVFQQDTRESWIWNSSSSTWSMDVPVSETWKNIGSGGTMSNGEAVPSFSSLSFSTLEERLLQFNQFLLERHMIITLKLEERFLVQYPEMLLFLYFLLDIDHFYLGDALVL